MRLAHTPPVSLRIPGSGSSACVCVCYNHPPELTSVFLSRKTTSSWSLVSTPFVRLQLPCLCSRVFSSITGVFSFLSFGLRAPLLAVRSPPIDIDLHHLCLFAPLLFFFLLVALFFFLFFFYLSIFVFVGFFFFFSFNPFSFLSFSRIFFYFVTTANQTANTSVSPCVGV